MKFIKSITNNLRNSEIAFWLFFLIFPILNFFTQGHGYSLIGSFILTLLILFFKKIDKIKALINKMPPIIKLISIFSLFIFSSILIQISKEKFFDNFLIMYLTGILFQISVFAVVAYILDTFYKPREITK